MEAVWCSDTLTLSATPDGVKYYKLTVVVSKSVVKKPGVEVDCSSSVGTVTELRACLWGFSASNPTNIWGLDTVGPPYLSCGSYIGAHQPAL